MISVQNVSFSHGRKTVLHDVSLDIPKGGITALVGANGAGKSTLLSVIARLNPVQTGRVLVDGLDVAKTRSADLARKLAILPQAMDVAPRLTISELVSFGRYPHHRGRPKPQDAAKVADAIEAVGLSALSDHPLDQLSGGQRQRAYVAMTVAQDTDYVLLDEPLNNLDLAASRALCRVLQELSQKLGRTVVVVVHDINVASVYADHIVALKDGGVAAQGPAQEIITSDFLSNVLGTDASIVQANGRPFVCP